MTMPNTREMALLGRVFGAEIEAEPPVVLKDETSPTRAQQESATMTDQTSAVAVHGNHADADYGAFLARVNSRFAANVRDGAQPVFTTDADGLWAAYLDTFSDPAERQHHNCHACRQFIERFGGLVTVGADGRTEPAIWHEDDAPDHYKPAVAALARLSRRAKVTGQFLSSEKVWGTPKTGIWTHLAVTPPASMVFRRATPTAGQAMAEKREDFKTVMHALNEFTQPMLDQAVALLKTDSLYRSEKVLGQAEWLHNLHVARAAARGNAKANVAWLAVAMAPAGFCHPRSSMIGTLLEDIAAGMDFGDVSRRFAAKMHPLAYQRPQAAPAAGAIAAAEKIVAQLNAAGALARRFARLDEVQALWKPAPKPEEAAVGGVFGHLKAKDAAAPIAMAVPAQTMTWDKFQRTVLPTAERIEIQAPSVGPYTSLLTAANADAPPILQWDNEDRRNPVSWYFWHRGSTAASFGLRAGAFHAVNAVALKPSMWNGGHEHHGAGALFVIDGAADSKKPTLCLFPEILRAEFHGVRSVIEAHSESAHPDGHDQQSAAGLMLQKGQTWSQVVRVWVGGRSTDYRLDRWD